MKIYEENGNIRGIANANNWIGNIYKELSVYDEAMKYYQVALKLRTEDGDIRGVANTTENISLLYQREGNQEEAMKKYLAVKEIREKLGDKFGLSHIYCRIGQIYCEQKKYPEALGMLKIALKTGALLGRQPLIAWIKLNIGKVYFKQNNYPEARRFLDDALSISKKFGSRGDLMNSHNGLAKLDSAENNFAQASEHYNRYVLIRDSLANEATKNKIALLKIQYETEKKDNEIEILSKDKSLQKQQLENQRLFRNGMLAGVVLLMIVGLLIFRSFRLKKKLEKQQAISQERNRISADLHDDIGSSLSEISLLSEIVKQETKTAKAKNAATKIADNSNHLLENMSEIIWALNSKNDYLENLVSYIRRYAAEYFENSPVLLKIRTPKKMEKIPISGEHRRNIFYAVKEALHNIIKHSKATEAELIFRVQHDELTIIISDNGKGMPFGEKNEFGNGLNNMENRMKSINGNFIVENHQGTKIILTLPLKSASPEFLYKR